jgi:hypothetical protein
MKVDFNSLLKNKNVLYVTLFLTITNMFGYLMLNNFTAIIIFLISGFASSYFSKNMIIIMLVALIVTNFLIMTKLFGGFGKEGFDTSSTAANEDAENKDATEEDASEEDATEDATEDMMNEDMKENESKGNTEKKLNKVEKKVKVKDFKEELVTANLDGSYDDDVRDLNSKKPKVNFASTLESAYDNLDKLLSSDAINKMSNDTQRLADKQKLLMGNIDKLAPIMKTAEDLLRGLNIDKMGDMLNGMKGKLDKFTDVGGNKL